MTPGEPYRRWFHDHISRQHYSQGEATDHYDDWLSDPQYGPAPPPRYNPSSSSFNSTATHVGNYKKYIHKIKLLFSCNSSPIVPVQHCILQTRLIQKCLFAEQFPIVAPVPTSACASQREEQDIHYRLRCRFEATITVSSKGQATST